MGVKISQELIPLEDFLAVRMFMGLTKEKINNNLRQKNRWPYMTKTSQCQEISASAKDGGWAIWRIAIKEKAVSMVIKQRLIKGA